MLELLPATAADYPYARQVHHCAYLSMVTAQFGPWDEAVQDAFFDRSWKTGNYSIILFDAVPCGYCRVDERDRTLQLVEFAIEVAKQSRGIGSKVIYRFLEMARAKGKVAQLHVMRTNTRAKALYERLGFAVYAEDSVQYHMRYAEAAVIEQISARLNAALAAGTHPDAGRIGMLVARSAVEPDFFVRDMLTWALTRHPPELVVPRLIEALRSPVAQARSQALHSLSKIMYPGTGAAITPALLRDADDEVAKSAWRAAVVLFSTEQKTGLAADLVSQLGRGDRDMQTSLSRALAALGPETVEPALRDALTATDPKVRAHAAATHRLLKHPESAFELDIEAARRAATLSKER